MLIGPETLDVETKMHCATLPIGIGDQVVLIEKPDGYTSRHYALTVGKTYKCLGFDGSNIVTTTDVQGESASYHRGRVRKASIERPSLDSDAGRALVSALAESAVWQDAPGASGWVWVAREAANRLGNVDPEARARLLEIGGLIAPAPEDYHMRRDAGLRRLRRAARNWLVWEGLFASSKGGA